MGAAPPHLLLLQADHGAVAAAAPLPLEGRDLFRLDLQDLLLLLVPSLQLLGTHQARGSAAGPWGAGRVSPRAAWAPQSPWGDRLAAPHLTGPHSTHGPPPPSPRLEDTLREAKRPAQEVTQPQGEQEVGASPRCRLLPLPGA